MVARQNMHAVAQRQLIRYGTALNCEMASATCSVSASLRPAWRKRDSRARAKPSRRCEKAAGRVRLVQLDGAAQELTGFAIGGNAQAALACNHRCTELLVRHAGRLEQGQVLFGNVQRDRVDVVVQEGHSSRSAAYHVVAGLGGLW